MATRVELRKVSVTGANPAKFDEPIRVHLVLEVFEKAPEHPIDVSFTWSPVWDFNVDQEMDEFEVGPFSKLGVHELTLESDPPVLSKIPDPTGPTALIISLSYQGRQFLHIGYNVIVQFEGEIPDVFTSADGLTRTLERCFPRQSSIVWDKPPTPPPAAAETAADADSTNTGDDSDEEDEETLSEAEEAVDGEDQALKRQRTETA